MGEEQVATVESTFAVNPIGEKDRAMLDNNFVYHSPKPGQNEKYVVLREQAKGLAENFIRLCPPSRERSVALTSLEDSIFWANAAIARNS